MSKETFLSNRDLRNGPGIQGDVTSAVLLGLVLLLGIALRLYDLGAESYWVDEMFTVIEAQQSIPQLIASGRLDQPLAYYLPLHAWVQIFGPAEVSMRSFSTLAGIGSIVLIYLVGRMLFDIGVGLFSAFLMAISGFQIYYSQEARYYSVFEFTTLLSYFFFILALRSRRGIHFILYGVASILMVYSHAFGIFTLAAQNLFLLLQGKKYRQMMTTWLICQALVLLAIVPYFYPLVLGESMIEVAVSNTGVGSTPSLLVPLRSVYHFVLPARLEYGREINLANNAAVGALLVAGTLIYTIRRGKSNWVAAARGLAANLQEVPDVTSKLLLLSCWLLCPIMLQFIVSVVIVPIYRDRYAIGAAPALYLLLALGITSTRKVVPLFVSLAVLVILIVPSLHRYYVADVKEQWKEVAAFVGENAGQDDMIVFAPIGSIGITRRTFSWYYQGTLQVCGLDSELLEPIAISEALMQCTSGHNRFWVIMYEHEPIPALRRYKSFFLSPNQTAMHLTKEHHFVGISVYLFELTP